MKVLQTIVSLSAKLGGPSTCVKDIVEGMYNRSFNITLLTVEEEDNLGRGAGWLETVPNDYKTPLRLSSNINRYLQTTDYDVYHANTLWVYSTHATCKHARKIGKPYVLSPHGMLYPTALKIKFWKKWLMLMLLFKEDIMKASCLHVTCKEEMMYCRTFGYKGPIAVIPNAIVLSEDVIVAKSKPREKKIIGFLGRLDPIKKVENVLYALDMIEESVRNCIEFRIIGVFNEAYEEFLRNEVKRLHLERCVSFLGFMSGKDKYAQLAEMSVLMVPSVQENFGMIVPEALACNTPVYASTGTPWEELNTYNCGWWKDNNPKTIAGVIIDILSKSDDEILGMGRNGRKLVEEKYEQHKVAGMMSRLYEWILEDKMDNAKKPEFVFYHNND